MASQLTNYISYLDSEDLRPRVGHLDLQNDTIRPLFFKSGAPIRDLYQVIQVGEDEITADEEEEPISASSIEILPPISGRDILAVGKNYYEHAKEFNRSGFDSSDKVDVPSHPVIFTKRATSIIPAGANIYHHPEFTQSLDYEGEIGVIIGKVGFRIKEEDALNHVWGYTIINDVTARERQRDHKQFFIGKSGDTFCPMGPIAKPAKHLPEVLRVQTVVNGQPQQDATTKDLIFSIRFLIKTLSEGTTLQPGDVIATGTPAGVGIGKTPPVYLQPGDTISVSVSGLGTLTNTVSSSPPATLSRVPASTAAPPSLHSTLLGTPSTNPAVLFLPHPGASSNSLRPLIAALALAPTHAIHLLSYPSALSPADPLDIPALVAAYARAHDIQAAALVAHGLSTNDAAAIASAVGTTLSKIVVLAPVVTPLSEERKAFFRRRGKAVARRGVGPVVEDVVREEVGAKAGAVVGAAVVMALEGGSADVYARWCSGLAEVGADTKGRKEGGGVEAKAVVGDEDALAKGGQLEGVFGGVEVVAGVGRWLVLEDVDAVAKAVAAEL